MASFRRGYERLIRWIGVAAGISIGLFAVSISVDLGLRLSRVGNIPGLNETIEYFLYAGVFLAAPWVLHLGAHVRVDLIYSALGPSAARRLEYLLDSLGILVAAALCYFGLLGTIDAAASHSIIRKTYAVPEWLLLAVFDVAMLLLAIEFLFRLLQNPDEAAESRAAAEKSGF